MRSATGADLAPRSSFITPHSFLAYLRPPAMPPGDAFPIGQRRWHDNHPCNPASNGERWRGAGGLCSRAPLILTKAGAAVLQISFLPLAHRPRRLPSFSPFCLATRLSQRSPSALARKPILGAPRIALPETCDKMPSLSFPVDPAPKDGGGFGPFSKFVASGAAHVSA